MRASLVIASHNEGDLLWQTVRSCVETLDGLDAEIVVADDASEDGSVDELLARYPDVRVVVGPGRRGVSPTKDLAARSSRGDVLVFLDAHCKPEGGALEALVRDVEAWDGAAVVTPRVASLDPERWECRHDRVGYGFWTDLEWFRSGWLSRDQLVKVPGPDGKTYLRQPALIGCCLAVSRDLYEALGGFDAGMRSHGSEDVDFGLKAWLTGRPIVLDTDALIGHRFRKQFVTYSVPTQHALLNQLRMARKQFGDEAWDDWTDRCRAKLPAPLWKLAMKLFEDDRASVERERDHLMSNRLRDEYWYAAEFGLTWPLTLPGSPYPPPEHPTVPVRISLPSPGMSEDPIDSPEPPGLPTLPPPPDEPGKKSYY